MDIAKCFYIVKICTVVFFVAGQKGARLCILYVKY